MNLCLPIMQFADVKNGDAQVLTWIPNDHPVGPKWAIIFEIRGRPVAVLMTSMTSVRPSTCAPYTAPEIGIAEERRIKGQYL